VWWFNVLNKLSLMICNGAVMLRTGFSSVCVWSCGGLMCYKGSFMFFNKAVMLKTGFP
jgi:hypothetical protein